MGTSVAQWLRTMHLWRASCCQLPKVLIRVHHRHQTSSAYQSTTAVGGTILVPLGRDTAPMTMSVVLLMNTMHLSMDYHHPVLHLLGRYHVTPLASVPLRKSTVTGTVSNVILKYSMHASIHNVVFLDCTAWMSCFSWYCGTVYEMELYEAGPPPPCPPPPANFTPPARPGECRLNVSTGRCNFFPNNTGKLSQQKQNFKLLTLWQGCIMQHWKLGGIWLKGKDIVPSPSSIYTLKLIIRLCGY